MTHSKLAKGMARARKYRTKPPMMNSQRPAVTKSVPISTKLRTSRKAAKPGEYKKTANRTCRIVKEVTESTAAAASSRPSQFISAITGVTAALEACRDARGRAAIFRAVLQSLRQPRDDNRVPPSLSEPIVQTQRSLEHGPADGQHFLTVGIHAGVRWFDLSPLCVLRADRWVSTGVTAFHRRRAQHMRQTGQTGPVDLPRDRLHDERVDKEDPCWDRRCRKLLGKHCRQPVRPRHRCGNNPRDWPFADRRCDHKGDQRLVLVIQHS